MKLAHWLTPYTKLNSKWIKDLNVRHKTVKILEESTGSNFSDVGHSNFFLDMSPEAREAKAKIKLLGLHQIKSFCTAKVIINKTKRRPMGWEKIFANDISDKGLVSRIIKNFYNSMPEKQLIQFKNEQTR